MWSDLIDFVWDARRLTSIIKFFCVPLSTYDSEELFTLFNRSLVGLTSLQSRSVFISSWRHKKILCGTRGQCFKIDHETRDQISSKAQMIRVSLSRLQAYKVCKPIIKFFIDDADSFLNLSMRSLNEVMERSWSSKFGLMR